MKEANRTCIDAGIVDLRRTVQEIRQLVEGISEVVENPIDCTLADLYEVEYIATALRKVVDDTTVSNAIHNLTKNAILDGESVAMLIPGRRHEN